MKSAQKIRLAVTLRRVSVAASCFLIITISMFALFNLGFQKEVKATANETLNTGSFIINMGVTPQTYGNGLKPYGMLYELINTYHIPIKWVINSSKVRDGIDFTYNGTNYSGGPFIIPVEYITSAVATRITYWVGQGVSGAYTAAAITVPVYSSLTVFPTVTIDNLSNKQSIIAGYYTNAGIPASAYNLGDPSTLSACIDIWTNPHGDPTWATHSSLYNFVTVYKSWIWAECHSVSVMESCKDPSSPFHQLNFLTSNGLQCYGNNKCTPAVSETHAGSEHSPYTYNYPTDPIMQFISDMHQAATGGSEDWYIPPTTGQWNSNTKQCVTTTDGSGNRLGVKIVYGPAYNNPANGYVMYEAGHDIDGSGTTAQKVSAQRAYFNFLLTAGISKAVAVNATVPATAYSDDTLDITSSASSGSGTYSYKWTSAMSAAFVSSTSPTTKYKVPHVTSTATDVVTMTVTDNCSRQNFVNKTITILNTLPIKLRSFKAKVTESETVKLDWTTASEVNNDYFTILRSLDGANFAEIGTVRGAGNSTILVDYSFTDEHPPEGKCYYRLKQTDYDGKSETFNILSVNLKEKNTDLITIHIYPNPFSDSFTAEFESTERKEAQVQILNLSGSIVYTEPIVIDEGKNSFRFSSSDNMVSGIYIFRIIYESSVLANTKIYCKK